MKQVDLKPLISSLSAFTKLAHPNKIVMVRNCESQGNLAGTITGWMDVPLTDFGRKQAYTLSPALSEVNWSKIHCSDLRRSIDTTFYAMAFPDSESIAYSNKLREIHFGAQEGLHFDTLPDSDKDKFADPNFKAEGGEGWIDVRKRTIEYLKPLSG